MDKKETEEMMDLLSRVFSEKTLTPELIDDYYSIFRNHTFADVRKATFLCLEECNFFPKPNQIISRIKTETKKKHDIAFIRRWTCSVCKAPSISLSEGKCRYCVANIPFKISRPKYHQPAISGQSFTISHGVKCQVCGQIATCIHELPDDFWQCKECYTGLTQDQYNAKIHEITNNLKEMR